MKAHILEKLLHEKHARFSHTAYRATKWWWNTLSRKNNCYIWPKFSGHMKQSQCLASLKHSPNMIQLCMPFRCWWQTAPQCVFIFIYLFTYLGALHRGRNLQNPNLHHIQQMRPVPLGCNTKEPENCCHYPNNLGAAAEAGGSTSFEARTREMNSRHLEQEVIEQTDDKRRLSPILMAFSLPYGPATLVASTEV